MRPDMLPEHHPGLSAKINDQIAKTLIDGTADLRKLKVGEIIEVTTTNTKYRIERVRDRDAEYPFLMSGHPRLCPEPVRASISGSTFDRSGGMLSIDFVGRRMFMEFHLAGHDRTFTTTEVAEVEEIGSGDRPTNTTANTAADDRPNADRNDHGSSRRASESNPSPTTMTGMDRPDRPRGGTGDQPSRAAAGATPAKLEKLTPSIWIITDPEGLICDRSGWFGSKSDCQSHIDRTFPPGPDGQHRYSPLEVHGRLDNELWIITNGNGVPKPEHGFFTSRAATTEHIERKLEPEADAAGRKPSKHRAWPIENPKLSRG